MQDEQPSAPAEPAEAKNCGCTCEFCTAGNHEQCQSGMCSVKTKAEQPPQDPAT